MTQDEALKRINDLEIMIIQLTDGWLMTKEDIRSHTGLSEAACARLELDLQRVYDRFEAHHNSTY